MTKAYALAIDLRKCIGCHACTIACKQENNMHLKSIWNRVETVGPVGVFPDLKMYYTIKLCVHCADPPCAKSCPTEAIYRRDDGIVNIDQSLCSACGACTDACPYDVMPINPDTGIPEKCHLCAHRIDDGLKPACVSPCVGQAIIFGDANDPQSEFSQAINAASDHVFVLRPELGTRPTVRFIKSRTWFDPVNDG